MNISDRIDNYLNDEDLTEDELLDDEFYNDSDVMDRMFEFITSLEELPEDKALEVIEIINDLAPEEVDEAISAKRVKIKPAERRKRKREYRKKRAQLKMKAKRFRRTAKYKMYQRKKKRKAKSGKTATGKRIRKFI
jgi:hypothetical protein